MRMRPRIHRGTVLTAAACCWAVIFGALPGRPPPAASAEKPKRIVIDQVRIMVNDRMMTVREVTGMRRVLEAEYRQRYSGADLRAQLKDIDSAVTKQLVEDLLLETQADKLGIQVDEKELQGRVDTVTRRDPKVLSTYTESEIKALISKQLLRQRVLLREVDAHVHVRDDELRRACEAEAGAQREIDVGHILFSGESAAALAKARKIRESLAAGADFEETAVAHSQDPSVSRNRGRLGFLGRGQFVKAFEDAAFSLPVGALSEPVKTPLGWHLIRVFTIRAKAEVDCANLDDTNRKRFHATVFNRLKDARLKRYLAQLRERAVIKIFQR